MEQSKKQKMMNELNKAVVDRDRINVRLCGMYIDLITDALCVQTPNKCLNLGDYQNDFPDYTPIATLLQANTFTDYVDDTDNFGYTTGPIEMTISKMYITYNGELHIVGVDGNNLSSDYAYERKDFNGMESVKEAYIELDLAVDLLSKVWDVIRNITERYEPVLRYAWKLKR